MNQGYWKRLSLAARWRLPAAEAQEVLADYQDMFAQDGRSEAELCQDLGKPVQVVQVLEKPKAYRRWLIVFWALTIILMLPAIYPVPFAGYFALQFLTYDLGRWPMEWVLLIAGLALSLVWFQRQGARKKPFPKRILFLLAVQLAGVACVWAVIWMALAKPAAVMQFFQASPGFAGQTVFWVSSLIFLLALLGVFALVMARLDDRRWRAVYVLGLTGAVLCLSMLELVHCMNLEWRPISIWDLEEFRQYILLTAVGLAGTGASLC